MIVFEKVRYKNFLSTGNAWTEIDLNRHDRTLIIGENGVGKSTFYEAITFALFGRPFRNINKPNLVNSINGRGCMVHLDLTVGGKSYTIERGIKPAVFNIICDGSPMAQASTLRDQQDYLERNVIKMNYKTFTQVVVLGSGNYTSFMNLPAAHRREIIEDLLDIQIFSKMNKVLKQKVDEVKKELDETAYEIRLNGEKMAIHQRHLTKLNRDVNDQRTKIEDLIKDIAGRIAEKKAELKAVKANVLETRDQIDAMIDPSKKINELRSSQTQLRSKMNVINKTIAFFTDNSTCSTCGQAIDEGHGHTIIDGKQKRLDELKAAMDLVDRRLEDESQKEAIWMMAKDELIRLQSKEAAVSSTLLSLVDQKDRAEDELKSLVSGDDADIQKVKKEVAGLEAALQKARDQKHTLEADLATKNMAMLLLKDDGIKSAIIKQYVPIMNKTINRYLSLMDFPVDFNVDESFNEVIRSSYRDEFTYNSFSEGEKARIDLALLFAWRALAKMKNSINCNILVLDEVFDGSLDGTGMEELFKILSALQGTRVFVISHKTEILSDKFSNVIRLEKKGGFSRIADE